MLLGTGETQQRQSRTMSDQPQDPEREQSGKNVKPQHTEVSGRHDSGLLYFSFLYSANKTERLQVWREELWLTRCN